MSKNDGKTKARFWSKATEGAGGCLIWGAGTDKDGYGFFQIGSVHDGSRRKAQAHRIAWKLSRGPIPPGALVLHKCDNPACVNPEHLFLGDHKDNMRDRDAKGRTLAGEDNGNSKLQESDVRQIRALRGSVNQRALAKRFGVSHPLIGMIQRGERWTHI